MHMNNFFRKIKKYIGHPSNIVLFFCVHGLFNWMPDEPYMKLVYKLRLGEKSDLKNPQTFSEKIQWLKLHDRKDLYTRLVDKYEAKRHVSSLIGEEYVVPNYGVWNSFDDIDFDILPNQFVLKTTHDANGVYIVKNKENMDIKKARKFLNYHLNTNFWWPFREWTYKNVKPRIIAEKFLFEDSVGGSTDKRFSDLINYKFYCFDGVPRFLYCEVTDFSNDTKGECRLSFFDMKFNPAPFGRNDHEPVPKEVMKPNNFNEMVGIASKLSNGIPFVRIDLYDINGNIYFSEYTFSPGAGQTPFSPSEWERRIGEYINIDSVKITA